MRNGQVAEAWIEGRTAHSSRVSTDGKSIWSYGLCIGHIGPFAGGPIFIRKAARHFGPGGRFYSMTTSGHLGQVLSYARKAERLYDYVIRLVDDADFDAVTREHGRGN